MQLVRFCITALECILPETLSRVRPVTLDFFATPVKYFLIAVCMLIESICLAVSVTSGSQPKKTHHDHPCAPLIYWCFLQGTLRF